MSLSSRKSTPLQHLDDVRALELLKKDDHQALEYIYRKHAKVLYNFGMKLFGRHNWVEDTLQELFVDLWKDRHRLAVTSLRTYLLKAFKYKLIRQHGKEQRWSCVENERLPQVETSSSEEDRIVAEQLTVEQQVRLAKTLQKLSIRQREVLHLLFQEGMSYEDVATIMGINVRSVYTLAWKSINSLRKLMSEMPYLLLLSIHFFGHS